VQFRERWLHDLAAPHLCQVLCDSIEQRIWRLSTARDAMEHLEQTIAGRGSAATSSQYVRLMQIKITQMYPM